ncbi:MAG: hypothetical protein LUE64_04340 [Candidatus Gastranaerophilales bacterium]|nr:hypothetical protein [Candidatus Gastranaerophilales bacterium]
MSEEKYCEIFKTGVHTDSKGNKREWTIADLETIKQKFDNVHKEVPICAGHPKSNSPAYGWFDKLKIAGNTLLASFKDVQPEFKEAVKKGLFKARSLSLAPDLTLRHLAFLGAQAPAIKGLEPFCFESGENDICIESNCQGEVFELAMSKRKNETIDDRRCDHSDLGSEGSGAIFDCTGGKDSQFNDDDKSAIAEPLEGAALPPHHEKEGATEDMTEELNARLEEREKEILELQAKLKAKEDEQKAKEFADWTDSMITEGRILPAQKQDVINILNAVQTSELEFADTPNNTAEKAFKSFVSGLKQIEFQDIATPKTVKNDEGIDFSDANKVKEGIIEIQEEYKQKGIDLNPVEALTKLKGKQ